MSPYINTLRITNMAAEAPKKSVNTDSPVKKKRIRSEEGQRAKRESDKRRSKTRITIGAAITKWQQVKKQYGIKTDSKMAFILLDSYLRTKSESRPERPSLERSSSTETCESVHYEYPFMMSSPNEVERETCAAVSVQSSENGKEPEKKEWTTNRLSENKENRDIQEDEDEEFSTSLSVGDGRYLVDLGSSSEFIVDEECILQLFRSCRECNRQCTVRKHVRGLKLVVNQACCFCQSRCKWTNLPDDDDDDDDDKDDSDFHINGKDTTHGQTNTAMSPSSNTS
ncbi:uncharacterized protein LOC121180472 isoform X4 [Toxotes jaculatrix]|uniref:uncharacterized protein LOC121180472 isoform X4 n=1 Tax=Toxotes jaculatrix TaxID=941984 RepID=UPI001B3AE237|nr:uncharacterized protein LOC121180472 isoform X4 [Toxotes jaculatrix]